mmetsp:Transcript_18431/g.52033  ORF Transcript_18431/g.52033 Transcript_18431/m.52033 type:complete len:298 (+) Transcript_18431:166-1059(+)
MSIRKKMAGSPVVAWVLENGGVILLSLIADWIDDAKRESVMVVFLRTVAMSTLSIDAVILLQHLYNTLLYSTKPFYGGAKRKANRNTFWWDYLTVHVPARIVSAACLTQFIFHIEEDVYIENTSRPFHLLHFLFKLFFTRIVSDVAFYFVHVLLHKIPFLYRNIHRTHHEHTYTTLVETNYRFHFLDLVLEGFIPVFVSFHLLNVIYDTTRITWFALTPMDVHLIAIYVNWYQIGSHSAQLDVPTVTWYPPASVLTLCLFPNATDHVEFHSTHHRKLRCNYGISTWLDKLLGTYRDP